MDAKIIRHGDVVLVRVDEEIPASATKVGADPRGVVLAEGEATGHAHVIADQSAAVLFGVEGADWRWLEVNVPVPLRHEEHHDVILDPGRYRVSIKREYQEDEKGWKKVED